MEEAKKNRFEKDFIFFFKEKDREKLNYKIAKI